MNDRNAQNSEDAASWSPEQMAQLMRLARQNLSAQKIAIQLGRTEEAVQRKAKQSGLVLSDGDPRHK